MELTALFLTASLDAIPTQHFTIDHRTAALVLSAIGHDIMDAEQNPFKIGEIEDKEEGSFLRDIELYQNSQMNTVIDMGRKALMQVGGQIEGVQLPNEMPFHFPEIKAGYIGQWIENIRDFCVQAKKAGAVYIFFPAE